MKINSSFNNYKNMDMSNAMAVIIAIYGTFAYLLCSSFDINSLMSNGTSAIIGFSTALLISYSALAVICIMTLIFEISNAVRRKLNPARRVQFIMSIVSAVILILNAKLTSCAFIVCRLASSSASSNALGALQTGWSLISNLSFIYSYKAEAILTIVSGILCIIALVLMKSRKIMDIVSGGIGTKTDSENAQCNSSDRTNTEKSHKFRLGKIFFNDFFSSKYAAISVAAAGFFVGCSIYILFFY